jgi:hypothetical protein
VLRVLPQDSQGRSLSLAEWAPCHRHSNHGRRKGGLRAPAPKGLSRDFIASALRGQLLFRTSVSDPGTGSHSQTEGRSTRVLGFSAPCCSTGALNAGAVSRAWNSRPGTGESPRSLPARSKTSSRCKPLFPRSTERSATRQRSSRPIRSGCCGQPRSHSALDLCAT